MLRRELLEELIERIHHTCGLSEDEIGVTCERCLNQISEIRTEISLCYGKKKDKVIDLKPECSEIIVMKKGASC